MKATVYLGEHDYTGIILLGDVVRFKQNKSNTILVMKNAQNRKNYHDLFDIISDTVCDLPKEAKKVCVLDDDDKELLRFSNDLGYRFEISSEEEDN